MTGTVSKFDHGWGFVRTDDKDRSVFAHWSDIVGDGFRALIVGQRVLFDIEVTDKGARARRMRSDKPGEAMIPNRICTPKIVLHRRLVAPRVSRNKSQFAKCRFWNCFD